MKNTDWVENEIWKEIIKNSSYSLSDSLPKYKSEMSIGSITLMNTKHFNWFQKIIWKLLLGIKIKDIKE